MLVSTNQLHKPIIEYVTYSAISSQSLKLRKVMSLVALQMFRWEGKVQSIASFSIPIRWQ